MREAFVALALIALCVAGCGKSETSSTITEDPNPQSQPTPPSPARLEVASITLDPPRPKATRRNNLTVGITNQGGSSSPEYDVSVTYTQSGHSGLFTVYQGHYPALGAGQTNLIDLKRKLVINEPGTFVLRVQVAPSGESPVQKEFAFTGGPAGGPDPPPADGYADLVVRTVPDGVAVEVGLQPNANRVTAPGSGRFAGYTPCTIRLRPSDVNPGGGINVYLSKEGYVGIFTGLSDGAEKLADHGTYELSPTPLALKRFQ